jgi:hypothetical protein
MINIDDVDDPNRVASRAHRKHLKRRSAPVSRGLRRSDFSDSVDQRA